MLISEMYVCSQGEGPLTGVPSILVRTAGCNLRCRWKNPETGKLNLCDTPFTSWNVEGTKEMSVEDVYNDLLVLAAPGNDKERPNRKEIIDHVIISGGEPTQQSDELKQLCAHLIVAGFHVTIETNGTKYVEIQTKFKKDTTGEIIDLNHRLMFSMSPKLESSTPFGTPHEKSHKKLRMNTTVLEALLKRYPSYLKFVISTDDDLKEVKEIQRKLKVQNHGIYLMPEGITPEDIMANGRKVNEICIENNFKYSSREHILLYGNTRRT